jgi:hypothetical protein
MKSSNLLGYYSSTRGNPCALENRPCDSFPFAMKEINDIEFFFFF